MAVLVDTSVWIDYFRTGNQSAELDDLIDENVIVTNDLILAELCIGKINHLFHKF